LNTSPTCSGPSKSATYAYRHDRAGPLNALDREVRAEDAGRFHPDVDWRRWARSVQQPSMVAQCVHFRRSRTGLTSWKSGGNAADGPFGTHTDVPFRGRARRQAPLGRWSCDRHDDLTALGFALPDSAQLRARRPSTIPCRAACRVTFPDPRRVVDHAGRRAVLRCGLHFGVLPCGTFADEMPRCDDPP
jgi:hypothetical protein